MVREIGLAVARIRLVDEKDDGLYVPMDDMDGPVLL